MKVPPFPEIANPRSGVTPQQIGQSLQGAQTDGKPHRIETESRGKDQCQ